MRLTLLTLMVLLSGCLTQTPATVGCFTYNDTDKRDYCLTNVALSDNTLGVCSEITKPDLRNGCVAALKGNLALCDNVTDKHWKDQCAYNVAVKTGRLEYCRDISDINYKSGCLRDTGSQNPAFNPCHGIGQYNEALWCYSTYSRDLLGCEKINDTFWRNRCVQDINDQMNPPPTTTFALWTTTTSSTLQSGEPSTTSLQPAGPSSTSTSSTTLPAPPADITECKAIQNPVERDWCISKAGTQAKSPATCELVSNQYWREACFRDVAAVTSDPVLCAKMEPGKRRDACYLQVGISTQDKTVCDNIQDNLFWNLCQSHKG